jgi:capsular polysaccharide biosynthesis protein
MQLSYVLSAARRYWWVVVACALVGALVGYPSGKRPEFMSRATFSVTSPGASSGDAADRFVATQVSLLGSQEFLASVAKSLGPSFTARELSRVVTVAPRSGTNIIDALATTPDGARSKRITKQYLSTYVKTVDASSSGRTSDISTDFDLQLASLRSQLADVDAEIKQAMSPYLVGNQPVPAVEQVRPDLASKKSLLVDAYDQVNATKAAALNGSTSESVQVIEAGTDPIPIGQRSILKLGVFTVAAFLAGLFLAVVLARMSRRVLDEEEITEITGKPVVGRLPNGLVRRPGDTKSFEVPPEAALFAEELCTRVEGATRRGHSLRIIVAGSEHVAHSSVLAASMAYAFGRWGLNVAYIDADPHSDAVVPSPMTERITGTELLERVAANAQEAGGLAKPAWIFGTIGNSSRDAGIDAPPVRALLDSNKKRSTEATQLTVIDMSSTSDAVALRRNGPDEVLGSLENDHDVAIIGSGSMLDNPIANQFIPSVDAIVLVVPLRCQTRQRLRAIVQQLSGFTGTVLIVNDRDARPSRRRRPRRDQPSATRAELPPPSSAEGAYPPRASAV